jgi:hypothetical protein
MDNLLFDEAEELAEPLPKYEAPKDSDLPGWLIEKYIKAGFKPWLWKGLGQQKTWRELNPPKHGQETPIDGDNQGHKPKP